ncbi:MAG: shufflon system plasmid conjugative transfer pilus tip adhesin PilV [Chitinophagales bacterium]
MKKQLLIIVVLTISFGLYAQNVGIGTASPDASAKLDIVSTNGGILIPRVNLISATDATTISSPATGLMVWNMGATFGTAGFYFNKGTSGSPSWVLVLDSSSSLNDADADPSNEMQTITAGSGLTGGGSGTSITLNTGAGDGITVNADDIAVNASQLEGAGLSVSGNNFNVNVDGTELIINGSDQLEIGNLPAQDADYIWNQNATDQAANFRINGTGQVFKSIATANGDWYMRGGDDHELRDINQANFMGIWGRQNSDRAGLQLGSDGSYIFGDGGNIGIGTTTPAEKLDVSGNVHASGIVYWGNTDTRTETRADAGLQGNAGAKSGFYETDSPSPTANWPSGASSWWHLLDVRHSNSANNYAMQLAGSFFDQNLYFRKTAGSATTGWSRLLSSSDINGTTNYVSKFTAANSLGNSQIYDNGTNIGFGNASPTYKIHASGDIYADGGWFRVSGNQGLYFQSWGGGWYMQDASWIRAYNSKSVYTPATMQADVSMQSPVFNFGNWNNGDPAFVDGQMYRTGGQGLVRVDDWFYVRDNDNNNRVRFNTDAGRLECGPGASNGDAITYGGYISNNSTSDGHQILPLTGNYGYVGTNTRYWWYMYANNFIDPSSREKKKDFTALDNSLYSYVMKDIDKLQPTFYRYKGETDELVEGYETKYRPNMHLGVILEDAPDYIQDQAFSGIDIYAMSVLSLAGVKYNRAEIQELKNNKSSISDFGQNELVNNEVFVPFNEDFTFTIDGNLPMVNITPTSPNKGFYLKEVSKEGFIIAANEPFTFNWTAMNTTNQSRNNLESQIEPQIDGLEVSEADKAKIKAYWNQLKQEQEAEYQEYLNNLKISDPNLFQKIIKENKSAEDFMSKYSK